MPTAPDDGTTAPVRHRGRRALVVVAIVLVVLVGAVYAAGGWYYSGRIDSGALALTPDDGSPVYDLTIVGVEPGRVVLAASADAPDNLEAPSSYLLRWPGGSGQVGPPTSRADGEVVRPISAVTGAAPTAGAPALLSRNWYDGTDPASALGLRFATVTVDGPLGALPAWYVPAGDGRSTVVAPTVAVLVHGKGGRPEEFLRLLPTLHAAGLPVLVISYRGDPGTAADPSGRYGFGATEWPDLAAAVSFVQAQGGPKRILLVGDSMGGAVVAAFMQHSAFADQVVGIVLDSPALDLADGVALGASQSTIPVVGVPVPSSLTWVAQRIAGLRFGVDWGALDYADDTSWVRAPVLVLHGEDDPSFPVSTSERFAAANPGTVTLVVVPGAQHLESWNTDRARVEAEVTGLLARATA